MILRIPTESSQSAQTVGQSVDLRANDLLLIHKSRQLFENR